MIRKLAVLPALLLLMIDVAPALATKPLQAQLCRGRTSCKIIKSYPAGKTQNGNQLRVIELDLGPKSADGTIRCRPYRREFWRVVGPANRVGARRMLSLCNDGYGASGVGEDQITVTSNKMIHHQNGGSAWRWDVKRTVSLDPLRVLKVETCSFHNISVGFEMTFWDWRTFRGRQIMKFKPGTGNDDMGCSPDQATHRFPVIPWFRKGIALAPAAAPAIGSCGLEIRGDGSRGFVVQGVKAPGGKGSRLRVLALGDRTLLITLDTAALSIGKGWRGSDHVQVWQGGHLSIDVDLLRDTPVRMFAVRVGDGKVFLGHGTTKARPEVIAHKVDKRAGGVTVRLRLKMPRKLRSVTVAFGKARDGKPVRLIATSRLARGKATSLGGTFRIRHGGAWCAVKKGRLDAFNTGNRALLKPE